MILSDLPIGTKFRQSVDDSRRCDCEFRVTGSPTKLDNLHVLGIPTEIVFLCWMHQPAGSDGRGPWVTYFWPQTQVSIDFLALALADTFAETLGG